MQQAVFKALADPTRRAILDGLKDGPRTTGDLAARFEQSRFGVMKHLGVLEDAGLITVERRGRERLNHLNAVPLHEIVERWLGPYQQLWASSLLALRRHVESDEASSGSSTTTEKEKMGEFNSFEIVQEVTLNAKSDKVWAALTTDIGKWWAYRVGDDEQTSSVSLDARLGGKFEERWGDGEGVIWGEVVDFRRGKRLRLKGALGMAGAGVNDYMYELAPKGDKTVLTLKHHGIGCTDPETGKNYDEGWKGLLGKFLPAWLESGKTARELEAESPNA